MKAKNVFLIVSLVFTGLPLALFLATGLLTIFDPYDQWQMPPVADLVLAGGIFSFGAYFFFLYWHEKKKEKITDRVIWDEHQEDIGRHSGLRR